MAPTKIDISPGVALIASPAGHTHRMKADEALLHLQPAKTSVMKMFQISQLVDQSRGPLNSDAILTAIADQIANGKFYLIVGAEACHTKDGKGRYYKRSRFFEQLPGIYALALRLDVPSDYLVALASYESGWLDDHNFALNNLWGLTEAGGKNIAFKGSPQSSTDYFEKRVGPYIKGVKTVTDFFAGLQREGYNSRNPNYFSPKGDLANRIQEIGKWKRRCAVS